MTITKENFDLDNFNRRIEFKLECPLNMDRFDKLNVNESFNKVINYIESIFPEKFTIKIINLMDGNESPVASIVYYGESREECKDLMKKYLSKIERFTNITDKDIDDMIYWDQHTSKEYF